MERHRTRTVDRDQLLKAILPHLANTHMKFAVSRTQLLSPSYMYAHVHHSCEGRAR